MGSALISVPLSPSPLRAATDSGAVSVTCFGSLGIHRSFATSTSFGSSIPVGLASDYDLLALDSLSGSRRKGMSMFPEVWKVFWQLLCKTSGKVVADAMTPAPVVFLGTTNLADAARLPVVDADGRLVGIITRGNVIRPSLQIKCDSENSE
ncbi:hypothetical protein Nepgr_008246 [Nepenthes gracilis]|uniref:CBS domain-containing protein n=1 Tax=Nepenthes gracilis TaxID=150966 RepID=A0AAD3XJ95_NEPGR|nr:hypothetical protein Nepgr_008246 [Nepenthes gracilis]